MSKQVKRKITVNLTPKTKTLAKNRPSVFERLGTKAISAAAAASKDFCHHWAQSGSCPYGKGCKYSATHTLISPSKQRAAKTQSTKDAQKRVLQPGEQPPADWNQWDPEELEDADPDDLEKRRQELQRELELQMKMENKAKKKDKKVKKESSPSSDSSSTTSESSSSSDDSSSSSSSSVETRRKKGKKPKIKRESSSSDSEPSRKHLKPKIKRLSKSAEKTKKPLLVKPSVKITQSPTRIRKQSQTPPLNLNLKTTSKQLIPKKSSSESKSPRPLSRLSDRKEKHRTPSPKPKEKEKEREKVREKEREREKAKERGVLKDKEREREKECRKKEPRSPKRELRAVKEVKKRDTPDSTHSRDRKPSPNRSKGSTSSTRRDHKSPPVKDERPRLGEKRDDRESRSRTKDNKPRPKDKRDSRDRERERERERRIAREEREAAREKEREEALARCQERQRERERLKELAKKEEEQRNRARDRSRREDRGLDKPTGDRVERLLPLPEERIPTNRKGHSTERDRRRERTPDNRQPRKSSHDRAGPDLERDNRNFDNRSYDRDYGRLRDDKSYDSPYDNRNNRRFAEIGEHYNDNSRDDREYQEGRRGMWNMRDEGDDREGDRRYDGRNSMKGREWDNEYNDPEWDRNRRPVDWVENRDNWDNVEHKHGGNEEDWRHYNRSMDSWPSDERRRWPNDWRERSRPCSAISANDESNLEVRRKELPTPAPIEPKPAPIVPVESVEVKKEVSLKRVADQPLDSPVDAKKPCIKPEPAVLEDDLSEISDDADEILNRDEEIVEEPVVSAIAEEPPVESVSEVAAISNAVASVQSPVASPAPAPPPPKEELIEDENIDLDFEEISEDELEEELRVKGIGDALGVDWGSLLAEARPRFKPPSSAKRRWESHNILANLGVSVRLAGEGLVKEILEEHEKEDARDMEEVKVKVETNGVKPEIKVEPGVEPMLTISHPIAAIQVANREAIGLRKSFFSSVGPFKRALSARRDLALRRHLCNLPVNDAFVEPPKRHDPDLFKQAVQLFERSL